MIFLTSFQLIASMWINLYKYIYSWTVHDNNLTACIFEIAIHAAQICAQVTYYICTFTTLNKLCFFLSTAPPVYQEILFPTENLLHNRRQKLPSGCYVCVYYSFMLNVRCFTNEGGEGCQMTGVSWFYCLRTMAVCPVSVVTMGKWYKLNWINLGNRL